MENVWILGGLRSFIGVRRDIPAYSGGSSGCPGLKRDKKQIFIKR